MFGKKYHYISCLKSLFHEGKHAQVHPKYTLSTHLKLYNESARKLSHFEPIYQIMLKLSGIIKIGSSHLVKRQFY